ncbi:MAG: hypothetical protein ACK5LT_10185, partial [Lachnospirales bacterium]
SIDNIFMELKKNVKLIQRSDSLYADYSSKVELIYSSIFNKNSEAFEGEVKRVIGQFIKKENLLNLSFSKFENLINSGDIKYDVENNEAVIKTYICNKIMEETTGVPRKDALKYISFKDNKTSYLSKIIDELIDEDRVTYIEGRLYSWVRSVFEYIDTLDSRTNKIMIKRLEGGTLEGIGRSFGVTKEGIRQIVCRKLIKKGNFKEDLYREIYEKYQIERDNFIYIFNMDYRVYNYLRYKYSKKNATLQIEDIMSNTSLPNDLRKRAEVACYRDHIKIGDTMVKLKRNKILDYYIYTYCRDVVNLSDVENGFKEFLELNNINFIDEELYEGRYFEMKLSSHKKTLWQFKRNFRYYDFDIYDNEYFFDYLNLEQYKNTEISANKIFDDSIELMKEYNLLNGYELHNLLKKYIPEQLKTKLSIEFKKMPTIRFGNCDKEAQVMDLLKLNAPIEIGELAKLYEEQYGFRVSTILANYFKGIDKYLVNGVYTLPENNIPTKIISDIRALLPEDFYFLEDALPIIRKNIFLDKEDVDAYLLKLAGYKVYTDYIVSDKFSNAVEYFRDKFTGDYLDLRIEDSRLYYIQQRYYVLRDLEKNLEYVEYESRKFMSIRKLEEINISKSDLLDFANKAYDWCNDEVFTVKSMKLDGFKHKLFDLEYDDMFYSSLIKSCDNLYTSRVGGTILFRKNQIVQLLDLITKIMKELKQIILKDLLKYIEENYGIVTDRTKVLALVANSPIYYSNITETVYLTYDMYNKGV